MKSRPIRINFMKMKKNVARIQKRSYISEIEEIKIA